MTLWTVMTLLILTKDMKLIANIDKSSNAIRLKTDPDIRTYLEYGLVVGKENMPRRVHGVRLDHLRRVSEDKDQDFS